MEENFLAVEWGTWRPNGKFGCPSAVSLPVNGIVVLFFNAMVYSFKWYYDQIFPLDFLGVFTVWKCLLLYNMQMRWLMTSHAQVNQSYQV